MNQTLAQLTDINNDEAIVALKNQLPEFDHQWLALMTPEERHLLVSLHVIKSRLKELGPSLAASDKHDNLRARVALLKGSLYWKISHDAPLRQEKLTRAVKRLEHEKQKLQENQKRILSAHRIMQRKLEPHQIHIRALINRIDQTQLKIKHINIKQKKHLQDIATQELDKQQKQLNDFLAITELSIARMHESAALKKGRK